MHDHRPHQSQGINRQMPLATGDRLARIVTPFFAPLSRKLGLPNYGSVGASCGVDVELDPFILHDAETIQQRVEEAFDVCRVAVDHELSGYLPTDAPPRPSPGIEPIVDPEGASLAAAEVPSAPLASSRQIEFAYCLSL